MGVVYLFPGTVTEWRQFDRIPSTIEDAAASQRVITKTREKVIGNTLTADWN